MADWQIGDLALCVERSVSCFNPTIPGHIYEVKRVWENKGVALDFVGIFNGHRSRSVCDFWGHHPSRFVKITPGSNIEGEEVERRVSVKERA